MKEIIAFAKKYGFKGARYSRKWKGYDVYEPYMDANIVSYIGLPNMILVKDGIIRMSTDQEAMEMVHDY